MFSPNFQYNFVHFVLFRLEKIDLLKATIKRFYPKREYMTKIVTKQHFQRLSSLLKDPEVAGSIVYGGSIDSDTL